MSSADSDPRPRSLLLQRAPMPLVKQRSWSPDVERDEAWTRRKGLHSRSRMGRSVTDEDLDELRGCIDLGFGFDVESPPHPRARSLSKTIPAMDLYYAVHRSYFDSMGRSLSSSTPSETSVEGSPGGSPVSIFSPGDSPELKKARLKQWAQVVACSVRQRC